jgi:hypothetical protein
VEIKAGIVQGDDGVLIANRLPEALPFVDEVAHVEKVPLDMLAAVEVAPQGQAVKQLEQPVRYCYVVLALVRGDGARDPDLQGARRAPLGGRDPHAGG